MRDVVGSVSWNDKMIIGLNDGNRAEGESLLPGFVVLGKKNYVVIDMKRKLVL